MKYGFIRACAATPCIRVADTAYNAESILADMKKAKAAGVELLVFPELCVTGYTCGDLFGQDVLLDGAEEALLKIAAGTKGTDMLVFAGVPVRMGGVLYNCAAALADGRVLGFVPKRHLPNYAEFYEKRNFQPYTGENTEIGFHGEIVPFGRKLLFQSVLQPELIVAAELCEDLWVPAPPSGEHAVHGATVIVNLSASDETAGKADYRELLCRSQSAKTVSGYVYADAGDGESTTDMVFAGHNILCENGVILAESRLFDNGLTMSEIDVKRLCYERRRINTFYDTAASAGYRTVFCRAGGDGEDLRRPVARNPFVPEGEGAMDLRAENILSMQAGGLKKRIAHTNAKTCVLGISGGLDSALALLVTLRAFRALGKDPAGIIAVTMPCFGTTEKTLSNSVRLMKELGVTARRVDIAEAVRLHFRDIGHDESVRNAAYENSQARMRTMVLMNIANDTGGFVVGTGDLSELALGWATYNGDHMSMYGVNATYVDVRRERVRSQDSRQVSHPLRGGTSRRRGGKDARGHSRDGDQPGAPAARGGKDLAEDGGDRGTVRTARLLPVPCDPVGRKPGEDLFPGEKGVRGRVSGRCDFKVAEELLPEVLFAAVQAFLPSRRREGGVGDAVAPGRLADAVGRVGEALAGRGGAARLTGGRRKKDTEEERVCQQRTRTGGSARRFTKGCRKI